jgi:hypothetical protein
MEIIVNTPPRVGSTALYVLLRQLHNSYPYESPSVHKIHIAKLLKQDIEGFHQITALRDPKDTIASLILYAYAEAKATDFSNYLESNIKESIIRYKEFYLSALIGNRHITIVDFQDIKSDPRGLLKSIIKKLNLNSGSQQIECAIEDLKKQKSDENFKNNFPIEKPKEHQQVLLYLENNKHLLNELYELHSKVLKFKITTSQVDNKPFPTESSFS